MAYISTPSCSPDWFSIGNSHKLVHSMKQRKSMHMEMGQDVFSLQSEKWMKTCLDRVQAHLQCFVGAREESEVVLLALGVDLTVSMRAMQRICCATSNPSKGFLFFQIHSHRGTRPPGPDHQDHTYQHRILPILPTTTCRYEF